MILHTIGDSHSSNAWQCLNVNGIGVKTHEIGPVTCSSFGFTDLNTINIRNYNINEGDIICFCFGEIDCRVHLCKPQNFPVYKELVDKIVSNYFETIKRNVEQYNNLTTLVYSVTPTIKVSKIIINPEYPHNGSDEQRKEVTLYMNSKLKEYCEKYNYVFFDVYDKYCDEEGLLNWELSDKTVHIANPIYLQEKLQIIIKL